MEAATRRTADPKVSNDDREFAVKLGALVLRCMGGRAREVIRVIDESGLTFAQMKVLVDLEKPGEDARTVTSLAEDLGVSAASASRAADGLFRKKLVTRVEDPDDRRVRRLALTAKGSELAARIISARLAGLEEFVASLDPGERKKLETALDALLERDEVAEIYRNYETRVRR